MIHAWSVCSGAARARSAFRPSVEEMPEDSIEILDPLPPRIDRLLGYFGQERFVAFHYEPRAQDVMWSDGRSFGIATGAWQELHREIRPLAELYDVNPGSDGRDAEHVLLCDRIRRTACFASRKSAREFLEHRRAILPCAASEELSSGAPSQSAR